MKTRKQLFGLIAMAIMAIAIIALPLAGCKEDEPDPQPQEYPQKQPDTPRTLSFGTVTIKSDDQFTATEWKTLCDKVVAAFERGYEATPNITKPSTATYFANNTVSAVLLKSATYDVEVKDTALSTMYFKANGSTIDGISGEEMFGSIGPMKAGGSFHLPL
jgi:hypothetical protein